MKLKEWADQSGIKYLTAYRWFKSGVLPVSAYQTQSGAIIVDNEGIIMDKNSASFNDAMSLFLKKTVEFSKNNASVEDFAAYVISNFQLKLNSSNDNSPKYSKNKPKSEEVQQHFKKFLPDKEKEEQLKSLKSSIKEGKLDSVTPLSDQEGFTQVLNFSNNFETQLAMVGTEDMINLTPQQVNYTDSTTNHVFSTNSGNSILTTSYTNNSTTPFPPTQKEIVSVAKVVEIMEENQKADKVRSKRGRKPVFKKE